MIIYRKHIAFFPKLLLKNKNEGDINKVIKIKFNPNKPILFNICKISVAQEKLYAHRFQGNPVNIFALT